MNDVSLAGAFLAGLVSFLSPCVLPLVPGYISMLSGVGMEQLRKGEVPSSSLLGSSLSFIAGFSVVFISFGASASAVGVFLKQNRNALTPIAGALILLFGLHLLGLLIKLNPRIGIIFGVILVALGIASLLRRPCSSLRRLRCASLLFAFRHRLFRSRLVPLAQPRRPPPQFCRTAHRVERLLAWLRLRLRLDSLHWPHPHDRTHHRRRERQNSARGSPPCRLLRRPRHPVSSHGSGHRQIHDVL
ncbi:MAG: hypothetical protein DMG56_27735 [Acidobacteria bacterium]|nr:MAG: hypothetical protein DMG56_27735 [Acidobacteriota bacterium]